MTPRAQRQTARTRAKTFILPVLAGIGAMLACDVDPRAVERRPDGIGQTQDATLVLQQSIGEDDSSADYQFSAIVAMLVTEDEKLWVVDGYNGPTPKVRIYDPDGGFLRTVGNVGSGPGEFRNPSGLALLRDGRVVLRDQTLTDRITVYTANGSVDTTWSLRGEALSRGAGPRVMVDTSGLTWIAIGSRPGPIRFLAYLRLRNGSIIDTVSLPSRPELPNNGVRIERRLPSGGLSVTGVHPPYQAHAVWALGPHGGFAIARTDEYRVEILPPYGTTSGSTDTISREVQTVPVADAERADAHDDLIEQMRAIGANGRRVPDVPRYKPPIKRLRFSSDGQLLVSVSTPSRFANGEWLESTAYDVFDQHQRLRGRITLPDAFTLGFLKRDELWGVWRDDYGVESVRRYSIRWPALHTLASTSLPDGTPATVYRDTLPSCRSCEIRLASIGSFGRIDDDVLLRHVPRVERDGLGRFYAAVPRARDHELVLYAPDGNVVRTVGRTGSGPGEFQAVWDLIVGAGDTLFVGHSNRVSAFDSTGAFVRTAILEPAEGLWAREFVAVDEERFVFTESRRSAAPVSPLQVYDREGSHLRSIGPSGMTAVVARARRGSAFDHVHGQRITARSQDGSTWLAGDLGGYRLENLDAEGRLRRVIGVEAPAVWNLSPLFMTVDDAIAALPREERPPAKRAPTSPQPGSARAEIRPSSTPHGVVQGIAELDDGIVLVVLHVPASDWQNARGWIDRSRHPQVVEPGYREQLYDTILDVIDGRSGEVIARRRVPGRLRLTSSGALYRAEANEEGVIQFDAFELRLFAATWPG
jgi:hypothetical protein